jgi:spore germination cell wall hydrolase CwlJ-like protein
VQQEISNPPAKTETQDVLDVNQNDEVHCLALNIYFEARSEPEMGPRAVGHVVMNRVAHPAYPDSVCQVVQQGGEEMLHRCQFSWWCDGRSDRPVNRKAWDQSLRLAREIYLGFSEDTTDGALWYHAVYVKPYWSDILRQGDRIGQHIFYLENQRSRKTL